MNVLHVASEIAPFCRRGGLGEVVAALARAQSMLPSVRPGVVSARYGAVEPERAGLARRLRRLPVQLGGQTFDLVVWEGRLPPSYVPLYLIEHPIFSDRDGTYGPPDRPGWDYPDNHLRFALLCKAALELSYTFGFAPDVIHAHDWPGALALYYGRRYHPRPATVLTIHNPAYKGLCALNDASQLEIAPEDLHLEGIEFYGQMSLLKAGILAADRVATVSPSYAQQILTPEHGSGLDGFLSRSSERLVGVLSGVDYDRWNPLKDPYLIANYGGPLSEPGQLETLLSRKALCKSDVAHKLGLLSRPHDPLCMTIATTLENQGVELILEVLEGEEIWRSGMSFMVLGHAEPELAERLHTLKRRHPGRVAVVTAPDDPLIHRAYAGADLAIIPARVSPSGPQQLLSLRYGTIPVVHATGSLDDTVVDHDPGSRSGTGFKFPFYEVAALRHAWQRALSTYAEQGSSWRGLIRRAMAQTYDWNTTARGYQSVYTQAIASAH